MLSDHRAHQQYTVTAAEDRQLLRPGPFFFSQVFGRGCEIVEDVLLFGKVTALVPFFAKLATAPNICDNENPAAIEPNSAGEIEIWLHIYAITAVAIKQRRIVSVLGC